MWYLHPHTSENRLYIISYNSIISSWCWLSPQLIFSCYPLLIFFLLHRFRGSLWDMAYTFAFLFISKLNGTVFMGRFFAVRRDHHITNIVAYYVYKEILTKITTSKRSILNHTIMNSLLSGVLIAFYIYHKSITTEAI